MPVNMDKLVSLDRAKEIKTTENGMIATVEASSTASKAYAVGDYFYYTGKLYKATAPIASGGTITVGTNCALAKLADDVGDLKSAVGEYLVPTNLAGSATYRDNYKIEASTGNEVYQSTYKASSYIDITGCQSIMYSRMYSTASNSHGGIAFYDAEKVFIPNSGIEAAYNQSSNKYVLKSTNVPEGAVYVRLTGRQTIPDGLEVYDAEDYNTKLPIAIENIETDIATDNDYINAYKDLINECHSFVDYGYEDYKDIPKVSGSTNGEALGIKRYGPIVELNLDGISSVIKVRLDDYINRTVSDSTVDTWTGGLSLKVGKKYRASIKKLSGIVTGAMTVTVYVTGTHTTIGTYVQTDSGSYRDFTAEDTTYHICLYIGNNATFENAKFLVLLEELPSEYGIKDYYLTEMNDTIAKVRNELTSPSLVFPWITDMHRYSSNNGGVNTFSDTIANITEFAKRVPCDFLLNTGDLTDGDKVQSTTLARAYACTESQMGIGLPFVWAQGNHDNNYATSGHPYIFTMQECYKAYFSPVDGIYNENENGTEYYIDFEHLNTRIISLNANNRSTDIEYSYGNSTAAWLETALNTQKNVIVVVHQSPISGQVANSFSTKGSAAIIEKLQAFRNNGGNLLMISGHTHNDIAFVDPFLSVMEDCGRFTNRANDVIVYPDDPSETGITGFIDCRIANARIAKTATEDLWSVCVYKPDGNELSLIRFGAGRDRYFHVTPIAPTTVTTKLTGSITWSSSNTTVATVSDGVITGVATGKCAILAKDEVGNYECWIVVVE